MTKDRAFEQAAKRYGKEIDMHSLGRDITWRYKTRERVLQTSRVYKEYLETLAACPICGSGSFELFGTFFELRYAQCDDCGHLFGLDQINEEGLKLLYSSEESASSIYIDEERFKKRIREITLPKVEFVMDFVEPVKGKKWLDIGASVGELLAAAKMKGWETLGVETDPTAIDFARKHGLDVEKTYITKDNASEFIQDVRVVSMLNIIEHLKKPLDLLEPIALAMPEDSWAVIEVPRHPSLTGYAMKAIPENSVRYMFAQHLHLFSDRSLELLLHQAGLTVKAAWFFGQDFYENLSILFMTHRQSIPTRLLEAACPVQQALDTSGLSDAMLVLAQKS